MARWDLHPQESAAFARRTLIADGHAPARYVAAQGSCIGREGRVYVAQDASGQVWVGGDSVTCITGSVTL